MPITHIEVLNAKNCRYVQDGQLLQVVPSRETPRFFWVRAFDGTLLQVSKKTKRINGSENGFFRSHAQPIVNL
jgi:hypothetical protein